LQVDQLPAQFPKNVAEYWTFLLLRACREWQCGPNRNSFDEIASSHCLHQGRDVGDPMAMGLIENLAFLRSAATKAVNGERPKLKTP
jgi:hypothetical protein